MTWVRRSPDVETWELRGLRFGFDQRVAPYEFLPWTQNPTWTDPPNRIQLVVQKREGNAR
jgi:hypothetical protein